MTTAPFQLKIMLDTDDTVSVGSIYDLKISKEEILRISDAPKNGQLLGTNWDPNY